MQREREDCLSDSESSSQKLQLWLGTISFFLCFAVWGIVSSFAPAYRQQFHLTATQTSLIVAVPVLLGSLGRIPLGMLTDRFGGRVVFTVLFLASAGAGAVLANVSTYNGLLASGFFVGVAGSSFSVGVGFVSKWFAAERQGTALGLYGMGNMGQSAVVFLGPVLAAMIGRANFIYGISALLVVWSVAFWMLARNAPAFVPNIKGLGPMVQILTKEPLAWVLSLFYFLTFGGFVAFSIYLPSLLKDDFGLAPANAGFRAAGFVVLATLLRPVGGALADRLGGARVLWGVFLGIVPFALLLAWPSMVPFTVGALGCAALLGLGNGAVFKLVPQYFPGNTATVTGLVGAMGGLGGFFPPLLLGRFRDSVGVVWPGFVLLAATSLLLWFLNLRVFIPRQQALELNLQPDFARRADQLRAGAWAVAVTGLLVASIVIGSRNLQNFDAALVVYTFAVIFATFGVTFHYAVWLQKPPTKRYWQRSLELARSRGWLKTLALVTQTAGTHLIAQKFIAKRSRTRWWMHQMLFWGCLSAAAITFPLVFGWVNFTSHPDDQMTYITWLFGFPVGTMPARSLMAWVLFHGLDFSAVLVLGGIALSLGRRMKDEGALALETMAADFLPLALLFAISVTGLALTVSTLWFRGAFYGFLAVIHAISVIGALLYLPFGKFFHIFQRPAQLGVKVYQQAGDEDEGSHCLRCGQRFASKMHIEDLKTVLPQLGFDYTSKDGSSHWQAVCPPCKRKTLATVQMRVKENAHGQASAIR
ncbi:MFS transporter [Paludibaculum fermentans]|uniref:MFS transporter n=1 Tax=Paludibaculum fermentans TaxID=1473598 RepID=A0A7S7SN43_PALFE|nr:MFS transporter [Paludibaculum fermentans]